MNPTLPFTPPRLLAIIMFLAGSIVCSPSKHLNWCIDAGTLYFTGSGVYFGQLDFNPLDSCDNITAETKLLQYPNFMNFLLHVIRQYYKPVNCGIIVSILLPSDGCLCP